MMRVMLLLTAMLVVSVPAPTQSPLLELLKLPIATSFVLEGGAGVVHEDGAVSFASTQVIDGTIQVTLADHDPANEQQGIVEGPKLTAKWTDKKGVTHTVETPIAGTTPAALQRAMSTHNQIVTLMQQQYPPKTP